MPVMPLEFDGLMSSIGYFEKNPVIAIATSGGGDSMALLLLANEWAISRNGRVISLTVNHQLRTEATDEAQQVAKWCAEYNIEHHILCWEHNAEISSSIHENARTARYRLMNDWCVNNNILHLLLAHHLDDQVETFFFRLARGSSLDGLSCMSAQYVASGVRLIRPFLQINKSRLIETLKFKVQEWIQDPSNFNNQYTRVHIRQQLLELKNETDIKQRARQIIFKFALLRSKLEQILVSQITNNVKIFPEGYGIIAADLFSLMEIHVSIKLLGKIIVALNGNPHPPRHEKLLYFATLIKNNNLNSKYSIGGLLFERLPDSRIIIYRETKSLGKTITINSRMPVLWDNRFMVEWRGNTHKTELKLQALGSEGLKQIKKNAPHLLNNKPAARILRTLPSLWLLEQLVFVPHINYINNNARVEIDKLNIKFFPAKPLAGSSFFVMNMNI